MLSCKNQPEASLKSNELDKDTINSNHYTKQDSVVYITDRNDTAVYKKDQFNQIVKNHPEFFSEYFNEPDNFYQCLNNDNEFSSEAGQDEYFILYSYFLKQKNNSKQYNERRKNLITIYSEINSLFASIQHGGTFFGHQYYRILGYAEYSIYWYSREDGFSKTYNVSSQKDIYIKSLRQLINDEIEIDDEINDDYKLEKKEELNHRVNSIEKLITDIFYLRRAQEFHYRFYEWH